MLERPETEGTPGIARRSWLNTENGIVDTVFVVWGCRM
jgi:hypothetical protein